MRWIVRGIEWISPLLLSILLIGLFFGFPAYEGSSHEIFTSSLIVLVYLACQSAWMLNPRIFKPQAMIWDSILSILPVVVLVTTLAVWMTGGIVLSTFQIQVATIALIACIIDVVLFGGGKALANRLATTRDHIETEK